MSNIKVILLVVLCMGWSLLGCSPSEDIRGNQESLSPIVQTTDDSQPEVARAKFDTEENSLQSLEQTDPIVQARLAFQEGDCRPLVTMGCFPHAPGVTYDPGEEELDDGSIFIVGSYGVITSDTIRKITYISSSYAEKYNIELLQLMKESRSSEE